MGAFVKHVCDFKQIELGNPVILIGVKDIKSNLHEQLSLLEQGFHLLTVTNVIHRAIEVNHLLELFCQYWSIFYCDELFEFRLLKSEGFSRDLTVQFFFDVVFQFALFIENIF